jgi:hypothetical protein
MSQHYSGPSEAEIYADDHRRDDDRDEAEDREASDSLWVEVEERVNDLLIECGLEDTPQNRNELRDQAWQEVTEAIEEERYKEIERRRAP